MGAQQVCATIRYWDWDWAAPSRAGWAGRRGCLSLCRACSCKRPLRPAVWHRSCLLQGFFIASYSPPGQTKDRHTEVGVVVDLQTDGMGIEEFVAEE